MGFYMSSQGCLNKFSFHKMPEYLLSPSSSALPTNAYNSALLSNNAYFDTVELWKSTLEDRGRSPFSIRRSDSTAFPFIDYALASNSNLFPDSSQYPAFEKIDSTDTQFFYYHTESSVVIAIRGSQEGIDWLFNFQFKQVPFDPSAPECGQVHAGFLNCMKSLLDVVEPALLVSAHLHKHFFITGHSLGGAIATLLAAYIRRKYDKKEMTVYTFGAPRCGDSAFAEYFSAEKSFPLYRFVHDNDIVTTIPFPGVDFHAWLLPPFMFMDFDGAPYGHIGTCVHLHRYAEHSWGVVQGDDVPVYLDHRFRTQVWLHGYAEFRRETEPFLERKNDHYLPHYLSILADELHWGISAFAPDAPGFEYELAPAEEKIGASIRALEAKQREIEAGRIDTELRSQVNNYRQAARRRQAVEELLLGKIRHALSSLRSDLEHLRAKYAPGNAVPEPEEVIGRPLSFSLERECRFQLRTKNPIVCK